MLERIKPLLFKRNTIIMGIVLGIVFILAVLITLMLVIRGTRATTNTDTETTPYSYNPISDMPILGSEERDEPLRLTDFVFDEAMDPFYEPRYYYYREKKDRWSEEDIAPFWIPIREIALDIAAHENDKLIEAIFK